MALILFRFQVKNIAQIELGKHVMDTWYFSPYPSEFKDCKVGEDPGLVRWVRTRTDPGLVTVIRELSCGG